jgi:hypothetical protein
MRTKIFQTGLIAVACLGMAACSSSDDIASSENGPQSEHARVMFSSNMSSASVVTRADGAEKAFTSATSLALKMVGTSSSNATAEAQTKYPVATAAIGEGENTYSSVSFTDAQQPYWDDFYGYSAQIAVTGLAIPGHTTAPTYADSYATTVSTAQTETTYGNEDVVFSNNLQTTNRMTYNNNSFVTGHLVFKHALSKITINLKNGAGFGNVALASTSTSVTLKNFPTSGNLDVAAGTYSGYNDATDITPQALTTANTGYDLSYQALVIPGSRDFTKTTEDAISITAYGNTYIVKLSQLTSTGSLLSNYNYTVNITVDKTAIAVTASITDWNETSVALTPVIATSTEIGFKGTSGKEPASFDMYRSTSVDANYGSKITTVSYTTGTGYSYEPVVYWPDHVTSYYFRGVTPGTAVTGKSGTITSDYVNVSTANTGTSPKVSEGEDLIMGAPYTDNGTTLATAATATSGNINFIFMHKKPMVKVILKTTTTSDKVELTDAVVTIKNSITTGMFLLSDLSCVLGTTRTDAYNIANKVNNGDGTYTYTCYVLPQSLEGVTMSITAGGNTYPVTLNGLKDASNNAVSAWNQGTAYTYTFTLQKTGIIVTASLTDWNNSSIGNTVKL